MSKVGLEFGYLVYSEEELHGIEVVFGKDGNVSAMNQIESISVQELETQQGTWKSGFQRHNATKNSQQHNDIKNSRLILNKTETSPTEPIVPSPDTGEPPSETGTSLVNRALADKVNSEIVEQRLKSAEVEIGSAL